MSTYYAAYAGLILAAILGTQGRDIRHVLYWVVLVSLFVFSGFRFAVGCDWSGYLNNYVQWSWISRSETVWEQRDIAHWAIIDLLHRWGLPYPYLNVATSGVFFLGLHAIARKQPNPLAFLALAFPILIINMPMSGIRQAAAIGLVCMAFVAFNARQPVRYVALVVAGSLFHSSALVFLLLAPFVLGRFSQRNVLIATLLALPGAYFLLQSESAELATNRYVDSGIEAAGAAFRLGLLTLTGALYFLYVRSRWKVAYPEDYKLASIGALMMVGFFGLFFVSTVIGDRFGYYLIPIQLMIFTRLPYLFRGDARLVFTLAPYGLITLVFLVWTQYSSHFQACYLPYRSLF